MEKLLIDDRVQCCEKVGELIMPSNAGMVLSVYLRTTCHSKAIHCFVSFGGCDKLYLTLAVLAWKWMMYQCSVNYFLATQMRVTSILEYAIDFLNVIDFIKNKRET